MTPQNVANANCERPQQRCPRSVTVSKSRSANRDRRLSISLQDQWHRNGKRFRRQAPRLLKSQNGGHVWKFSCKTADYWVFEIWPNMTTLFSFFLDQDSTD
ncbi:hypothetical protein L596_000675 [Steinernema carpocapsae]|uniref:Uncharacterized protein n=1 Tax=Steinernema carpocapsae TaxID=34508 RepID=A0A4U8UJM4_STECR|nr:hypothetical protein L596_000675 [Steinernema carpocapsae]